MTNDERDFDGSQKRDSNNQASRNFRPVTLPSNSRQNRAVAPRPFSMLMTNDERDFDGSQKRDSNNQASRNFRPVTLPSNSRQNRAVAPRPFSMPQAGSHASHGSHGAADGRDPRGPRVAGADGPGSHDPRDPHDNLVRVKKKRKKQGRALKICLGVLVVVLVLVVGSAGALIAWVNSLNSSIGIADERERTELLDALAPADTADDEDNAVYVAILGSDARSGDTVSRSDVVTLVRIDETAGVVDLISIPRDTMVNIEGQGTQKINAAYSFGGASGAVSCISEFAGVPINHYVEVHFDELETVVDKLGGIWVDIPESFSAGNGGMSFTEGTQRLNGEQALAFARERYNVSGGDFGRAQAQRLIIMGIVNEVLSFTEGTQRLNGEQALAFARERYNVSGGDFGRAQAQRLIIMGIVNEVLASSPATQRLNGEQALAFARERYNVSGGDFGRAQAQRLIIMGIVNEVLASSPAALPGLVGDLAQCISTDYSVSDLVHLAIQFQQNGLTMYSAACPSYSLNVDGRPRPMHFHRLLGERPCSSGHSVPAKRAHHVLGGLPQLQPERRWHQLRGNRVRRMARDDAARRRRPRPQRHERRHSR